MKNSHLCNAIAICLGMSATQTFAVYSPAQSAAVNNMLFGGTNYMTEGTLTNTAGDLGLMQSVDNFFNEPWAASAVVFIEPGQPIVYDSDLAADEANLTNGTIPAIFDDPFVNGSFTQNVVDNGGGSYVWTGTADQLTSPGSGSTFSYTFTLGANEVAWGTLFNWNTNGGIPVLVIMDCLTVPGVCSGTGTPMVTTPFPDQDPTFSGGIAPLACPDITKIIFVDEVFSINKTDLTEGCTGGSGPVNIASIDAVSNAGAAVVDNGTTYTYLPVSGYKGSDSFGFTLIDDIFTADATYKVQTSDSSLGNFTMMNADGITFVGANDVVFIWDGVTFNTDETDTNFDIIKISSNTPFTGVNWTAHHIRVYDGGASGRTLTFDTTCTIAELETGTADCGGTPADMMELIIPVGMYGAHIHFDWNDNNNIDIVNVWEPGGKWQDDDGVGGTNELYQGPQGIPPSRDAYWELVSRDVNGDGINGAPMIDGPFPNNYANFNRNPSIVEACELFGLETDLLTGKCIDSSEISPASSTMNYLYLLTSLILLLARKRLNDTMSPRSTK